MMSLYNDLAEFFLEKIYYWQPGKHNNYFLWFCLIYNIYSKKLVRKFQIKETPRVIQQLPKWFR